MSDSAKAPIHVGIIGGGQLSQMLVQAAPALDLQMHVLANSDNESAAQEPGIDLSIGTVSDLEFVRGFLAKVSVCGFESELVDFASLRKTSSRFVPGLEVMERLSEKIEQKRILKNLEIPSAPFVEHTGEPLEDWFDALPKRLGESFVVKWSKYGYDGRGVLLVDDESSFAKAKASARVALSRGVRLYAETRVKFVRELAIIACHSTNGDFATYPLVISEQEHGICRRVKGPAVSFDVNARFERLAVQYAEKLAKALPLFGAFGLEFFETPEGDLWVNEIAPRVHNSGHYTQDASPGASQFTNHLRALTGQMLASTRTTPYFAMLNLLGPQGITGRIDQKRRNRVFPRTPDGIVLHWYNKEEVFPGRKLGHLNCAAETREELTSRVRLMENYEREWEERLRM